MSKKSKKWPKILCSYHYIYRHLFVTSIEKLVVQVPKKSKLARLALVMHWHLRLSLNASHIKHGHQLYWIFTTAYIHIFGVLFLYSIVYRTYISRIEGHTSELADNRSKTVIKYLETKQSKIADEMCQTKIISLITKTYGDYIHSTFGYFTVFPLQIRISKFLSTILFVCLQY